MEEVTKIAKSKTIGASIKLDGEKEYRQAITSINSSMRLLRAEAKKVASGFDGNAKSLKSLKTQTEVTSQKVDEQIKKIRTLQGAVEHCTQKYGENSEEVKKWKTSLHLAEAELSKLTDELESLEKQTKGIGKIKTAFLSVKEGLNGIKEKVSPVTNGLKKIADVGAKVGKLTFKAVATSLAAVGTAAVAAGKGMASAVKASIEGYGEYEQLVGGVETLFKDSSKQVVEYANNAYKTAGLTANEYMETVTNFSASLLQSLNGDTAKATEVADMAITDMSDNANKMGTDISSIQNAYQGFAKQNYTMLDNLKLGYGGTKSEMERLLSDAEKLSGQKYDISNLNDVYQAIHVIQTDLGITGTTAKEATETIQGSVTAVKSTFKNLITGLADENANIKQLAGNFSESVVTAAHNIIPRIVTIVQNLGPAVSAVLTTLIPELLPLCAELIDQLVTGITQNIKPIIQAAMTIISTLANALTEDDTIAAIIDATLYLIQSITDMLQNKEQLQKLINAAIQITLQIAQGLLEALPQILDAGLQLVKGLIKGLWDNRGLIWETVKKLGKSIIESIKNVLGIHSPSTVFADIGKNLIQGMINGITNAGKWLFDKVRSLGQSVIDTAKSVLGIHSPSTVFDELGDYTGQGFGNGFVRSMVKVRRRMKDAIPTSLDSEIGIKLRTSVSDTLDKVGTIANTGSRLSNTNNNFSFVFNISVDRSSIESTEKIDAAAEELSQKIYKKIKRKMEAFA